jgi:hypothetical protein
VHLDEVDLIAATSGINSRTKAGDPPPMTAIFSCEAQQLPFKHLLVLAAKIGWAADELRSAGQ